MHPSSVCPLAVCIWGFFPLFKNMTTQFTWNFIVSLIGSFSMIWAVSQPANTIILQKRAAFGSYLKHKFFHYKGNSSDYCFLACSRACASKVFSLRADCGRVIVYPGLKQWERPRHNIFGVCTRLAGGVCMSTSANSSASKHLTVTKIVWKIVYVTFDYLISHFFKILSLEFMANLFRDFRASVSLKVFHYRLRGKWCQYDLEIN